LFIACGIGGVTVDKVTREIMPYMYMLGIGLLLVIAFPWLTLVLPRVFGL
jgi:C4-dicarboxylate transporter DctM subunit